MSPVLLRAYPGASEPHDIEPFGPVATVITYSDLDDAVRLAARGQGSLVGSIVTHDADVARALTLGLAPWHGRLLVLDRTSAAESTGHGSPLPVLVHGGPGRAGGGEELGGVRAVLHHMQRSAIQGSPDMLTAIGGQWITGSTRTVTPEHPFRKSLAELAVGDTISSESRVVTLADIEHFAEFTGDTFYAHTDEAGGDREPALRRHRGARLPRRLARGRAVRRSRPGPGARQLRRRPAALPDPGQGRRLHQGRRSRSSRSPRGPTPTTARSAGTRRSPTAPTSRWRRTTCSRWSRRPGAPTSNQPASAHSSRLGAHDADAESGGGS